MTDRDYKFPPSDQAKGHDAIAEQCKRWNEAHPVGTRFQMQGRQRKLSLVSTSAAWVDFMRIVVMTDAWRNAVNVDDLEVCE